MPITRDRPFIRLLTASGLALATMPLVALEPFTPALAASESAQSGEMKLLKLEVVGNARVPTATIDQAMTVSVGQRVTRSELAANFKAIVDVYRRANVGASFKQRMTIPRPGQVRVEYIIDEKAPPPPQALAVLHLDKVTFEGNKQIPDAKIQAAIPLHPGDVVSNASVISTQQAILALYKKAGVGVTITPSASYPQPNHAVVNYSIKEQNGG